MHNIPQDDTHCKQCTGPCKRALPATSELFGKDKNRKDGLYPQCKECRRATDKAKRKERAEAKAKANQVPDGYKKCARCEQLLLLSDFQSDKTHKDGLRSSCKDCTKELRAPRKEKDNLYSRQWFENHPGYRQEYDRDYCLRHKEKRRAYSSQYHSDHRETERTKSRQYRIDNIDRVKEYQSSYTRTERGRAIHLAKNHKRRALKKESGGSYTPEQIQDQLKRQRYRCYYAACGHAKFQKKDGRYIYHVDHVVPLSKGGSNGIENIVCACPECNMKKHNKLPSEWPDGGRLL